MNNYKGVIYEVIKVCVNAPHCPQTHTCALIHGRGAVQDDQVSLPCGMFSREQWFIKLLLRGEIQMNQNKIWKQENVLERSLDGDGGHINHLRETWGVNIEWDSVACSVGAV